MSLLTQPEVDIDVVVLEAIILASNEFRTEMGDFICLVDILDNPLLAPHYIFWYQNERRRRKILVIFLFFSGHPHHSGKYT